MNATLSIVTKITLKKGHPIILDVSHTDVHSAKLQRTRKTIGHAKAQHWDFETDLPNTKHPDQEVLLGKIIAIRDRAQKSQFTDLNNVSQGFRYLTNASTVTSDVQKYASLEVALLRSLGKTGNAQHVENCLKPWVVYAPGLTFEQIDRDLISRFKKDKKTTISDTTIKAYIGVLRKIYNIALADSRLSLVDNGAFKNCMKGLKVRARRARNVYLNDKNLKKLKTRKLKGDFKLSPGEVRALDFTLLQFYLGGANLKDVCFLERKRFYKKRVLLKRTKLGDDAEYFDLKVVKAAREIFEKYNGDDPIYCFDIRKDEKGYKTYRDRHNKHLRSLQIKINLKVSPINDLMSSNVIRHTFATRGKFLGINADIIRELMGHERDDIDTVYKDKYPQKVRDRAHKKIIKIVASS